MTIVPDTKDWTWVLLRPCRECGMDTQSFPRDPIHHLYDVTVDRAAQET